MLMSDSNFYTLLQTNYNTLLQTFDASNSYIIDSLGYVRWISPVNSFETILSDNKVISEMLLQKGISSGPSARNKKLFVQGYKTRPLEIGFMLIFNDSNITEGFGSKERLAYDLLSTLEEKLLLSFDLRKISHHSIGGGVSEYTLKCKAGICKDDASDEFIELLKLQIIHVVKEMTGKSPEFN